MHVPASSQGLHFVDFVAQIGEATVRESSVTVTWRESTNAVQELIIKKQRQVTLEAHRQIMKMLEGVPDVSNIAQEILRGMEYKHKVLISCAITVTSHDFANWSEKEITSVAQRFTSFVSGTWRIGQIFEVWEDIRQVGCCILPLHSC